MTTNGGRGRNANETKQNQSIINNNNKDSRRCAQGEREGRSFCLFGHCTSFLHCSVHLQVFQYLYSVPPNELCAFQVRKSGSLASFLRCGPPRTKPARFGRAKVEFARRQGANFFLAALCSRCAVQSVGACDRRMRICMLLCLSACASFFLSLSLSLSRSLQCSAVSAALCGSACLPACLGSSRTAVQCAAVGRGGREQERAGALASRRSVGPSPLRPWCLSAFPSPLERHSTRACMDTGTTDSPHFLMSSPGGTDRCTKADDAA